MRAGFGRSLLTPPLDVELAGYGYYLGRKAQYVLDDLYARAVVLEAEGRTALVISCDLLGLSRAVCDSVKAHAKSRGISGDAVMIVSVHTHTGPCIKYHEGCGMPDDAYVATVAGRISQAVDNALADFSPVLSIKHACAAVPGEYIYNRAAPDGPVDHHVRGFYLERQGKPSIALISAACHGVFRGRIPGISADLSGAVNTLLEAKGDCSIYLNGLCGDIDPKSPSPEKLSAYAGKLVQQFQENLRPCEMTLSALRLPFTLRLMPVTREDILATAQAAIARSGGRDTPAGRVAFIWQQEMLEKFQRLSFEEEITIQIIFLGGIPMIAFPFEGFTAIGEELRQQIHCSSALTLGCAEELLGYLPTRDDIGRGAYAALESTFLYKRLPIVPGEAERLSEEMGRALSACLYCL